MKIGLGCCTAACSIALVVDGIERVNAITTSAKLPKSNSTATIPILSIGVPPPPNAAAATTRNLDNDDNADHRLALDGARATAVDAVGLVA